VTAGERVREIVEPLLTDAGLDLFDVELAGSTLRVLVDREGGIDLDAVSKAAQLVSDALDRADPLPGRYVLEVSSPGVERPLRTPDHFRGAVGTAVAVRTNADVEGDRRIEGTLESVDDEGVVVAGRRLPYADIERARTVFVWGPAGPAPRKNAQSKKPQSKKKARAR
jgi:ribosome maturation factor RimP